MNSYFEVDDKSSYGNLPFIIFAPKNEKSFTEEYYFEEKDLSLKSIYNISNDIEKPTKNNTNNKDIENKDLENKSHKDNLIENKIDITKDIINSENVQIKTKKTKKKSGREKKSNSKIVHNKFSDDNLRIKCKHLVLKYLLKFLNDRIYKVYGGNIGKGIYQKQLKVINQKQQKDANINFNKKFMTDKIKDIFSVDITKKFSYFPVNHNKELINKLLNESDVHKKIYFEKLFNLEFVDCLKHFIGEKNIDILKGLKLFSDNDIKNDIINNCEEDGFKYYEKLKNYLNNYEKIISNKKARKPKIKKK